MKEHKKTVAIIPIKSISKRVKNKNFKIIGGKPLFRYLLDKLKYTHFDEIYVDSDSKQIEKYCKQNNYKFIHRLPKLAKDNANGNDLLNYHAKIINADIYFQLYITAPLLEIKTINNCIKILKSDKHHDSILTIKKIYSWFWFNGKPTNYNPKILPRSQDAEPIVQESTGLYGIKREALIRRKCRIGFKPFFYEIHAKESVDLDTKEDFKYLNYLYKKR
jgi:CMP-N-acetylneuraminic acid synthetase